MRKTEALDRPSQTLPVGRALRLLACAAGIGLCLAASAARAQDDEEDDTPFEDKIIRNLMSGIGGTNMDNKGIDYRERSPLVMPPKIDLPPPETAKADKPVPNWPNDPSVKQRKEAREAAKQRKADVFEMNRSLTPSELAPKRAKTARDTTVQQPGSPNGYGGNAGGPMLEPSQLGFKSGMFSNIFKGNSAEEAKFSSEPTRESLTQPPPGYQTPSPNYSYGTGPAKPLDQQSTNALDPNMAQKPVR
jgi:hypothetical protein